ncbi:MAG: hypothetical protein ACD_75C02011G0004 [uncultured bacterium]|nr:MAG: hypothetical protein ACD_75C02011G0004 [uncultured bacterium]
MKEAKPGSEGFAVGLDRLPDRWILGVIVDDNDLVARIIQPGEGVERIDHHIRRLVVGRNMDRHHGQHFILHLDIGKGAPPLVGPDGLGPFVRLGEQDDHHPDDPDQHQKADDQHRYGQVLLRITVDDPDGPGGGNEGDRGEKTAPALAERPAVDEQERKGNDGDDQGNSGKNSPFRQLDNGRGKREFGLARGVVDPPVGAHRTFAGPFPGLIERLHDVVGVIQLLRPLDKAA